MCTLSLSDMGELHDPWLREPVRKDVTPERAEAVRPEPTTRARELLPPLLPNEANTRRALEACP